MQKPAILAALVLGAVGSTLASDTPVTFTKDIAPILQQKCEACHREGSMAPMPLVSYEESRPWAESIKEEVASRRMLIVHINGLM